MQREYNPYLSSRSSQTNGIPTDCNASISDELKVYIGRKGEWKVGYLVGRDEEKAVNGSQTLKNLEHDHKNLGVGMSMSG